MAYMNQEMKKTIAVAMKPVLKKYGVKATLSVENLSTIHLNIKSSKFDFMKQAGYDGKYMTVNPYSYERDFSGELPASFRDSISCPLYKNRQYRDFLFYG